MSAARAAGACLLGVVTLLSPTGAGCHAGWSPYPAGNVPVTTATGDQRYAAVSPDGAGGVLVAWEDTRSGTDGDIYAQRIDADGDPVWDLDGVAVVVAPDRQQAPAVVADGTGGAVILWEDRRDGAYYDIYAQRIDATGNPVWNPDGVVVCGATASQYKPSAAPDGAGGLIVAWYDWRSTVDTDIYAQRVDPDGVPLWATDGVAVSMGPGRQQFPAVVSDGTGGALIVWEDRRPGGEYDISIQRVDAAGLPLWTTNGVTVTNAVKDQMFPSLAGDGSGGAVVVWEDWRSGTQSNLFAQRVGATGLLLWGGNGVSVSSAGDDQYEPVIQRDPAGTFLVVWEDWRPATDADVYLQRLGGGGSAGWPDGLPVATGPATQQYPRLSGDGAGGAVVAWHQVSLSQAEVRGQWIDAGGVARCPASGLLLSDAAGDQRYPLAVGDLEGGAICVWEDGRGADTDLYAQRQFLDFDGDGVTDCLEARTGTDPGLPDTDGDGLSDYAELAYDGDGSSYSPATDTDPLSPDTDADQVADGLDCLPLDGSVWSPPWEVSGLTVVEDALLEIAWNDQAASAGPGTVYDLVSGSLAELGDFSASSCRAADLPGPPYQESVAQPAPGDGWLFLLRAENGCGVGTYGSALRDQTAPGACP